MFADTEETFVNKVKFQDLVTNFLDEYILGLHSVSTETGLGRRDISLPENHSQRMNHSQHTLCSDGPTLLSKLRSLSTNQLN